MFMSETSLFSPVGWRNMEGKCPVSSSFLPKTLNKYLIRSVESLVLQLYSTVHKIRIKDERPLKLNYDKIMYSFSRYFYPKQHTEGEFNLEKTVSFHT